ncbi:MAG: glycogen synthase GlgA [Lachnospiraceae bacterium]|nr:glycogen synthase GlgA [Lachnospiraceae bacterium]
MERIKVLFAVSECFPFIKTGGLADVAGALPKAFDPDRYDVRVVLPKYSCIASEYRERMEYVTHFYTGFQFRDQYIGVLNLVEGGVTFYFIDSEYYFSGAWPYGDPRRDIEKFAFFSRAVLSVLPLIGFKPDILHCHDWQTALIPVYLNDYFQGDLFYRNMKTVMTIHNLKFQGIYDIPTMRTLTGLSESYFTSDKMEAFGCGNLLKGGLVYADRITTVSKTYKEEVQTAFYGEGLDGILRAKSELFYGIVNGIDTSTYDPKTDASLPQNYDVDSFVPGKRADKTALQKRLGLEVDPDRFLIGIVSRLTDQKGFDLIECVMNEILMHGDTQVVVLGTGEQRYEGMFRSYAEHLPDRVSANICYSEPLSRQIYAASDAFLMPSLFEPCGLSQLIALRYGSLPIVRETGGLKDTVHPYNEFSGTGNGFSFTNYNAHDMLHVIEYARKIYYERRGAYQTIVEAAMKSDYSWKASAREYQALYEELKREKEAEEKVL